MTVRDRPVLLYRGACPKCRVLSRLAVLASLGSIRREPIGSARAEALNDAYPGTHGQLTLFIDDAATTGWRVIPRAAGHVLAVWRDRLLRIANPRSRREP